jgi:putative ABC transport system ATP-binding protein
MLSIEGLVKSFEHQTEPVINQLHLTLAEGEFCVVLGSNGSGKSTLLKCISGEYAVDAGNVEIAGENVTHQSLTKRSRLISHVTQDAQVGSIAEMTLLENMTLSYLRTHKKSFLFYKRHLKMIQKNLERLGLEHVSEKPLSHLSGGQRQMVVCLMAFLTEPKLLLLDEHTSALAPHTQQQLMAYTVSEIKERKITTLMITHHLKDALQYGDRLILLHKGKMVLDLKGTAKTQLSAADLMAFYQHLENDHVR